MHAAIVVQEGYYLWKGKAKKRPTQTELVQLLHSPVSDTAQSVWWPEDSLELNTHWKMPHYDTVTFLPMCWSTVVLNDWVNEVFLRGGVVRILSLIFVLFKFGHLLHYNDLNVQNLSLVLCFL